eukprot:SAG31_NODE_1238_length_9176_cov_9.589181_14_plen_191_part_00
MRDSRRCEQEEEEEEESEDENTIGFDEYEKEQAEKRAALSAKLAGFSGKKAPVRKAGRPLQQRLISSDRASGLTMLRSGLTQVRQVQGLGSASAIGKKNANPDGADHPKEEHTSKKKRNKKGTVDLMEFVKDYKGPVRSSHSNTTDGKGKTGGKWKGKGIEPRWRRLLWRSRCSFASARLHRLEIRQREG